MVVPLLATLLVAGSLLLLPALPPALATWPPVLPAPLLLGLALAGPRGGLALLLVVRIAVAGASGAAAALPPEPLRQDATVTGVIREFPRSGPGRLTFTLDVAAAEPQLPRLHRVQVTWYGPPDRGPRPGERWQFRLRLKAPRGLANPGAFDYERWLFAGGIGALAYVRDPWQARNLGRASEPFARLLQTRDWLAGRVERAMPEGIARQYVLGLALGIAQSLPEDEWELLRRTGTTHLVSVSGFHLTLAAVPCGVAGLLMALPLARRRWAPSPRVAAAVTALLGAAAYAGLAGFAVPTLRSLFALAAVALCLVARRRRDAVDCLALAAVAALMVAPLGLLTPGFWLSFLGVLALVLAFRWRGGRRSPGGGPLAALAQAQIAACLALLPLTLAWFGQASIAGTLANLVAIPAFSFVVLPPVLLGTALSAASAGAAAPVLALAGAAIDAWRAGLTLAAGWPFALVELASPDPAVLVVAGAGVVLALWPRPLLLRWLAPACLLPLWLASPAPLPGGDLRVTVIDVGQGLAVLVQTARHALLYDAGPAYGTTDAGERVVLPVLRQSGVRRLDRLLISHGDADHRGGAASVRAAYPATRVLSNDWPDVRDGPDAAGSAEPCIAGDAWRWDGVDFRVLAPAAGSGASDNDRSCVLLVTSHGQSVLLPGDIEAAAEAAVVAAGLPSAFALVVAPHHGSRTSSTTALVTATRPRFVAFATGHGNRWGFPRPDVVDRWVGVGACPLDTAATGAMRFDIGVDGAIRVAVERSVRARLWRAAARLPDCAARRAERPVYSGAGLVAP